jgi:hypothetical protein
MHPQIVAMAAAEHVKDMQAEANRGRRVREARRARRGAITISAATNGGLSATQGGMSARNGGLSAAHRGQPAAQEPCPQLPCPPITARAA